MFCTNCGARLTDGSNFCPYCGNKISERVKNIKEDKEEDFDELTEEEMEKIPYSMHQEMDLDDEDEPVNEEKEKEVSKEDIDNNSYLFKQKKLDKRATFGFICSLLNCLFCWSGFFSGSLFVILGILGIVLGANSLQSRAKHRLAKAALILGIITTAIFALGYTYFVYRGLRDGSLYNNNTNNNNGNLDELIKILFIK